MRKIVEQTVKAEQNVRSKSLKQFVVYDNANKPMHALRFSMKGLIEQEWMTLRPRLDRLGPPGSWAWNGEAGSAWGASRSGWWREGLDGVVFDVFN